MSKVALITGASSGIGESTALRLLDEGYIVYGAARRVERMKGLEEKGARILALDVTDEASMGACVQTILDQEGRIDVLVNNAGYGNFGSFEETPLEVARAQYEVNVFGLARMTQLVIPAMRAQGSGRIVNISSIGGKLTSPFGGWYQSTKYAVESLSDAMRMELKPFGIDVVIIEPGIIESEWEGQASEALLRLSGDGVYGEAAKKSVEGMRRNYQNASPSAVVADAIVKSVRARTPRTRYAVGAMASMSLTLKALLPDRAFDRVVSG